MRISSTITIAMLCLAALPVEATSPAPTLTLFNKALGELLRLQTAWATLAPMVTPDEREHWLAQLPAGGAVPVAPAENADH